MKCSFCNVSYLWDEPLVSEREQRKDLSFDGNYVALIRGVDEDNRIFLIAQAEDDTDRYYPKFCPECGRKLED